MTLQDPSEKLSAVKGGGGWGGGGGGGKDFFQNGGKTVLKIPPRPTKVYKFSLSWKRYDIGYMLKVTSGTNNRNS